MHLIMKIKLSFIRRKNEHFILFLLQEHRMKVMVIVVVLLLGLHTGAAIPSNRWSCYKKTVRDRNCHEIGPGRMRPIDSLQNHYWEDDECDVVCYCNLFEMLCCPR